MRDMEKAHNMSGVLLVCACLFGGGMLGLASTVRHASTNEGVERTTHFQTVQDCERQTDLKAAEHFDQEVRSMIVQSFCSQTKTAGRIETAPVSGAGMTTPEKD